jgi:hypothetical protein
VVWWDPSALPPHDQGRRGTRLTDFLKEDENKLRSEEGIRVHFEWQANRAEVRQNGGKPEWTVVTATSHAGVPLGIVSGVGQEGGDAGTQDVEVETIRIDFSRPHGQRFGVLVHAILSLVPLNADRDSVSNIARVQGRILGTSDEEVAAGIETVHRALSHPLIKRAASAAIAGKCRREVPVAIQLENDFAETQTDGFGKTAVLPFETVGRGFVVEGIVDLAFQEQDGGPWTVVDYKTDFEMKGRLEDYRTQVGLYAAAVARATGAAVKAVLLRI